MKYNNYSGLPFEMQLESHQVRPETLAWDLSTPLQIEQVKNENDAIRNRISDFDKRRISQPKTPINKPAINDRRLLIAAEFHFVHPVYKDS